jgi:uncharacterized protein (DUF885 family)
MTGDDALTPSEQLASTLASMIHGDLEAFPVSASALGRSDYDGRLDDVSADAFRSHEATAAARLAELDAIADEGLSPDEHIDRDLARSVLRGRLILAPFEAWRRDPIAYSGPITGGLFTLFLHRLTSERDRVDASIARLAQAGAAIDAGIANLDPGLAHPVIVERGLGAARAASRYVRELVWQEVTDPGLRTALADAGRTAGAHLERWVAHLEQLLKSAHGSWQLGEERYTRILREREVLDDDARALRERGQAELERLGAEMAALARDAAGNADYVAALRADSRDHAPSEQAMLEAYAATAERARAFLAETGLVTLPAGETCAVVPSPVFQRPVLGVASYVAPPAFSDRWKGHFFVPFAPDGASESEVQERLSANAHGTIPTITVHETYPGHHWHMVMRKGNPSDVRRVYSTPYFSEGWALYAERVMRERGFFGSPLHELHHLNASLFRAARIVVDTSLHLDEMTVDEAVRFMVDRAALPEPVARAEVGRYCWIPTQASSYLTGCLEILSIRDAWLEARGFAGVAAGEVPVEALRDFHDAITSSGALPLGLARRAVLGETGDAG